MNGTTTDSMATPARVPTGSSMSMAARLALVLALGTTGPLLRARGTDRTALAVAVIVGAGVAGAAFVGADNSRLGRLFQIAALALGIGVTGAASAGGFLIPVVVAGLNTALACGALVRWRPLPRWPQRERPIAGLALGPLLAANLVWARTASVATVAALMALTAVIIELYARAPGLISAVERSIERVAEFVADILSRALAVIAWVTLLLPTWAMSRLARYDQLDHGSEPNATAWATTIVESPSDATWNARRLGGRESEPTAAVRRRLTLRALLSVLLIAAVSIPVVRGAVAGPWSTGQADTLDLRRRSAEPGKPADIPDSQLKWNGFRVDSYAHEHEPWIGDFFRELLGVQPIPDLMLGSRNGDFHGRYLNVVDGIRASYEPPDPSLVVWFFGGSTMYGIGQRDDHTIPSVVAHQAEADGIRITAVNFGVSGDVNWQETIRFMEALESGRPLPDLVVFYDGVNDRGVASQRLEVGSDDPAVSERFTASDDERALQRAAHGNVEPMPYGVARDRLEIELAAAQYRRGVETARRLGEAHGIDIVPVWQPQPFAKRPSPADDELYRRLNVDTSFLPTATRNYARIREQSQVDPIDLTSVLDDVMVPVYFDSSHTNEYGARLVGEALYQQLRPHLQRLVGSK